jgi:hypothetical protein
LAEAEGERQALVEIVSFLTPTPRPAHEASTWQPRAFAFGRTAGLPGASTRARPFPNERRALSVFARFSRLCARLKALKRLQLRTDLEGCSSG